jgi:hypothetical protein
MGPWQRGCEARATICADNATFSGDPTIQVLATSVLKILDTYILARTDAAVKVQIRPQKVS